jgi:hypothetical protein
VRRKYCSQFALTRHQHPVESVSYTHFVSRRLVLFFSLAMLIVLSSMQYSKESFGSVPVSVTNESSYPWLVPGAYASYFAPFAPFIVLPNGSLLASGVTPPGAMRSYAQTLLSWTVTNRSGGLVQLDVDFAANGCLYSEKNYLQENYAICTSYNYTRSLPISVNVMSDEAFVNGTQQGLINFWEPPLLSNGTIYSGTMFLNGTEINSEATTTGNLRWNMGGQIDDSGKMISPPILSYSVEPDLYAVSSPSSIGWFKTGSNVVIIGTKTSIAISPVGPFGYYDYYNGLALEFSGPSFPTVQTVCKLVSSGEAVEGCQLMNYSTTLGNYFRVVLAEFVINSTNIQLLPPASTSASGYSGYIPITLAVSVVIAATGSLIAYRHNHSSSARRSGTKRVEQAN